MQTKHSTTHPSSLVVVVVVVVLVVGRSPNNLRSSTKLGSHSSSPLLLTFIYARLHISNMTC